MGGKELSIQQREYKNEIDLVDLFKILIKNWKIVIGVWIFIIMISFGGALHVRSNTYDKNAVDFVLRNKADSFFINKASLTMEIFRLEEIFIKDEIVEEFYEIEELNMLFMKKNNTDEALTIYNKRKFLGDIIKLEKVEEGGDKKNIFKNYQLSVSSELGEDLNKKIINKYLEIVEREKEIQIQNAISRDYDLVKNKTTLYNNELASIEEEIKKVISKEPSAVLANEGIIGVISTKYPRLFEKKNQVQELYKKYSNELIGLEGLKADSGLKNQVEVLSSIYQVKVESKAKLILLAGIIFGLSMGISAAFIKEFFKHLNSKI
ncbi:hypothetical protein [uncultured Ilyobacter sp.]|uniref:hypothetical protein n=1 Tax=uncultured Ilyobacter sp. TaxID=544433 RepID=UPI0029F5A601|nr:hypothetical protein [uncultured Ilyobacter sp.]